MEAVAAYLALPVQSASQSVQQRGPNDGIQTPRRPRDGKHLVPLFWSIASVALATVVGLGLTSVVALPNVSMVFLLAVVFSAARFGIWPALLSSLLSFLAYNFFFIEPLHTFSVARPHELLALVVFLAIAVLTSTFAGRAREQATKAVERARASRSLYEFAKCLSGLADTKAILQSAVTQVDADLTRACIILLAAGETLQVAASSQPDQQIDNDALIAAHAAYKAGAPAGAGTGTCPQVPWLFLPLRTPADFVGVIGLARAREASLEPEARTLFQTMAELISSALERARLDQEITTARTVAETERVRNTLLASISHDFRTPLASILGAASSLIEYGARLPETSRCDLLTQVKEEAEHLDSMVRNLLAMTRVEAGALEVNKDWVDVRELFHRTISLVRRRGATQRFETRLQGEIPLIPADPILLDQVFANIVGNAVRYTSAHAQVILSAQTQGSEVVLSVTDNGPGIPSEVLGRIFEKFIRAAKAGDAGEGTGLGLAIAKGIVEAHQGSIRAQSPVADGRGTRIEVRLPFNEERR